MEQEENKTYIQGFNDGYRMNMHNPDLFEKLKETLADHADYSRGFQEGGLQAEREREKERQTELDELRGEQEQEQEIDR